MTSCLIVAVQSYMERIPIKKITFQINHSKQCLQTITIEITAKNAYKLSLESHFRHCLPTVTELIPNNTYKLLQEKSFKTMLTNCYKKNHYTHCLQTIIRKFIPYNAYKPS